jgi:hypothetical protein
MGTKADFYFMDHDGSLEWFGSVNQNGRYNQLPVEILLASNKIIFEELVSDMIAVQANGSLKYNGDGWPYLWEDSRMTDYTYIFHECTGKVYASNFGQRLFDPIKMLQGMDMLGADNGMGIPNLPKMREIKIEEIDAISAEVQEKVDEALSEMMEELGEDGSKPAETV